MKSLADLTDKEIKEVFKVSAEEMGESETLDFMDAFEKFGELIDALPVEFLRNKLAKDEGLIEFLNLIEITKEPA